MLAVFEVSTTEWIKMIKQEPVFCCPVYKIV